MSIVNQKIFKRGYVSELRDKIKTGENICDYFKKAVAYPADSEFETEISVDLGKLQRKFKDEGMSASDDLENAIAIYEAYPNLNETQASDSRLWVYLTHVTL